MPYPGSFDHQSNVNPSQLTRPNALNGGDDNRALLLKLFSGEMFKGFQNNTIARDLVMKRTLKNGRSLQFIYTGRTTSEFHKPGQSILGNDQKAPPVAEKTITCDDLLISSAFVYELDEVLSHYDLRSEISRKIGYALAEKYDRYIFRAITRGARAASPVQMSGFEEPGGTQISVGTAPSTAYNATNLVNAFYDAAAALDEKGISQDGRVAILSPRQYYQLIRNVGDTAATMHLINRDATGAALQSGKGVVEIAGIRIYKSMNLPFQGKYGVNYTSAGKTVGNKGDFVEEAIKGAHNRDTVYDGDNDAGTADAADENGGIRNDYGAYNDFDNSCGLIFQREAAGCVEAIAPQVQTTSGDVSVIYQGDVILGRLAMGADYVNPAAAVELYTGDTPPPQFGKQQGDGTGGTVAGNAGYQ